jgi:pimeloyl-ACP methyl ester carboxylesterase
MRRPSPGLAAVALAALAGAPLSHAENGSSGTPQPSEWAGGYVLKGRHASLTVRLSPLGVPAQAKADSLFKDISDRPLKDLTWDGRVLRGDLQEADGLYHLTGKVSGDSITGEVEKNGLRGPLRLVRLSALTPEQMRGYEGAYRGAHGVYLVERLWVGHWMINVAEEKTGIFRALFPAGAGRFVSGPRLMSAAPVEWRWTFSPGALTVEHNGRRETARKLALHSEDVSFQASDGVTLAGTLVTPATPGRHPAIIFMHGSGAAPRMSNFGLGYWLATRGFAVLKYDKRGSGQSGGTLTRNFTYERLGEDGAAAARFLSTRPEVDSRRVGFWGVSEGGWTAPLAATAFPDAAFVIIASGSGLSPADQEMLDTEDQLKSDGRFDATQIAEALRFERLRDDYARTGEGWAAYQQALQSAIKQPWWNYPSTELYGWSKPDALAWKQRRLSYFYDPKPTLRKLEAPVLVLYGGLDTPKSIEQSLAAMRSAFAAGGNRSVTYVVMPRTNHNLFLAASGNENEMDETDRFSPLYFPTITHWLTAKVLQRKGPA